MGDEIAVKQKRAWTVGDLARLYGVKIHIIHYLVKNEALPPSETVGAYHTWSNEDLPIIRQVLKDAGYIS